MNTRRKSTLFLVEQLIVIAVFALCAVACISILTTSYFMAKDSNDTAKALIAAKNWAEAFKAAGGNAEAAAFILYYSSIDGDYPHDDILSAATGDSGESFGLTAYYDSEWQQVRNEISDGFVLTLSGSIEPGGDGSELAIGEVSVDRVSGGNLVRLPVAAAKR